MLHIVADENILYVKEAFNTLGTVQTVAGRRLNRSHLSQADVLLVRSITPVNAELLAGTPVQFVGTATIGYDHVDIDYLCEQRIAFASAPGSNATSTAEYVVSALLTIAEQRDINLREQKVGIVGCGNVGSRVLHKLQALGIYCCVYDPFLQEKTKAHEEYPFVEFGEILSSNIITFHVPLEKSGRHPTYHLVNADFLEKLRKNVILLNTARGDIVDEAALFSTLTIRPDMTTILDVWHGEPHINLDLVHRVTLGTPHIAGYSLDGKARGTEMLYRALCQYFDYKPTWNIQKCLPAPPVTHLAFSPTIDDDIAIQTAVMTCYDVRRDAVSLRLMAKSTYPSAFFDNLRKRYAVRREFSCLKIQVPEEKPTLAAQLSGLGFNIEK